MIEINRLLTLRALVDAQKHDKIKIQTPIVTKVIGNIGQTTGNFTNSVRLQITMNVDTRMLAKVAGLG